EAGDVVERAATGAHNARLRRDRVGELDEDLLALAADDVGETVRERLVRADGRVRTAGDEGPAPREARGDGGGRLDVERLQVQADEIGPEGGDDVLDLVGLMRRVRRRGVEERDLVAARPQRGREMAEREERRLHRLR